MEGTAVTEIGRAKPENAATLTDIALAAKRHWGYRERWIEKWRRELTIRPESIATQEIYVAITAGRIIGFYGLNCELDRLRLEHMWVLPEAMNKGIGRALFTHALARASALGFQSLEIEADPNAEGFYLRMGARRVGATLAKLEGEQRELPILVCETASPVLHSPGQ